MSERRYSDEEVRRILSLAAEAETAAIEESDRPWSLRDIERIGAEAGIAPQAVSAAALALEHQPTEGASLFGLPVAVSRAVPLSRGLSDADWDALVAQLRETFAARGHLQVSGARREWRVGNLRVTHEPAGTGALLRMRTRKGDAQGFLAFGALLLMTALYLSTFARPVAWLAGVVATLLIVVGLLRLPAWARRRERQFEALAAYARRLTAST